MKLLTKEIKMELKEKIEKELGKHFPAERKPCTDSWRWGFRTGFRSGYSLAYEEANERLRKLNKED